MKKSQIAWFFDAVQMQTFLTIFLTIFWGQNHIFGPKKAIFLTFQASIEQECLKVDETKSFSMIFRCHSDADILKNFFDNFLGQNHTFGPKNDVFLSFQASIEQEWLKVDEAKS